MDGSNAALQNLGGISAKANSINLNSTYSNLSLGFNAILKSGHHITLHGPDFLRFRTNNAVNAMYIASDGRIGMGTSEVATGYKLSVYGKIMSEELMVKLKPNWPDYVFKKDYNLRPLKELEKFVEEYNHLPGIPSAIELEKNGGFQVGEMQRLQLEKMEELYLYVIDLSKEVEKLKEENKKLNAKIKNK